MNNCTTCKHLLLNFVDDTHYVQRRESRFHFCVVFVQPLKKNINKFAKWPKLLFKKARITDIAALQKHMKYC